MPHFPSLSATAAFTALAVVLAGCVSPRQFVSQSEVPVPTSGYVGGQFVSSHGGLRTALVLVREGTTEEIVFPFSNASSTKPGATEVGVLSLPAGRYVVRSWMVYNVLFSEQAFVQDVKSGPLATTLDVQPNKIIFLGKLNAQTTWTPGYTSSTTRSALRVERLDHEEARASLVVTYPKFADLAFSCVLCNR